MVYKHAKPFIRAFSSIAKQQFGQNVHIGELHKGESQITTKDVSIIVGVTNELVGQIIFGMEQDCSKAIVKAMMGGIEVSELDDMGRSALQEYFNWVCGNAAANFIDYDPPYTIDITPPIISIGISKIYPSCPEVYSVPLQLDSGISVELTMSVKERF
ncbi:hypothetical protein BHU72_02055 [Desulfuribacillus stibiiarsenatis]|uniref:Chemotaxis phosphatase CheX-like domain-containing protein n=1 Tax=Desulfuribacillus stibiiarsenatis TaxID=1390249 RepID=A0A1E5L649_9FIRM|nr:chemotaxis protein CheX [Desulfuribacillus stibiiarsenatis]OEH85605.1 hypothetical protein BHU72_02055 [Desulfuribacillus stibiiarsenatis]